MGDMVCKRFKIIRGSLVFLPIAAVVLICSRGLMLAVMFHYSFFWSMKAGAIFLAVVGSVVQLVVIGLVPFFANVIPFAMDQLRDLPSGDSSAFVYWYVWTIYAPSCIVSLIAKSIYTVNSGIDQNKIALISETAILLMLLLIFVLGVVSLVATGRRPYLFNADTIRVNPYKLVYRVTRFAWQHTIPIRRSAFTYCEDDPPSRLDLGKSKYGGPFTMEEVEDVKVFYQVLKILVSLGPFMYVLNFDATSKLFNLHLASSNFIRRFILIAGPMKSALIAVLLPIFIYCYQRQFQFFLFLSKCQSLRKIEIGMIVVLIKLVLHLLVDVSAHYRNDQLGCMFNQGPSQELPSQEFPPALLVSNFVIQHILTALSLTILYSSFFEFICAQNLQSMKGTIIGVTYALLLGVFVLPQLLFTYIPWNNPQCGFIYFSINLVVCLISFIVFVWVAKGYKYRQRDEVSRVRQYAEEYYSNPQQEPNYDYSTSL